MSPEPIRLTVNGKVREGAAKPRKTLADFLREDLGLTGTHVGCEHGVCGACTILFDDEPARSCIMLAVQADGHAIRTVEGLAPAEGGLHPIQAAFKEAHALMRKSWEVPGPWRWEGEHFNYRNVNPWARPYQTPMPQWQAGVISRNTLEWAADNRYPYIMIATKPEATAEAFQYYRDYAKQLGWEAGPQHLGYMIKTHVQATDEKAYEVGKKFLRGTANPFIEGNEGRVKGFLANPPGMLDRRRLLPISYQRGRLQK